MMTPSINTAEITVKVVMIPSIIPTPYCNPFRHPIWRWKMRHMRRDLKQQQRELGLDPLSEKVMQRLEEAMFLGEDIGS